MAITCRYCTFCVQYSYLSTRYSVQSKRGQAETDAHAAHGELACMGILLAGPLFPVGEHLVVVAFTVFGIGHNHRLLVLGKLNYLLGLLLLLKGFFGFSLRSLEQLLGLGGGVLLFLLVGLGSIELLLGNFNWIDSWLLLRLLIDLLSVVTSTWQDLLGE